MQLFCFSLLHVFMVMVSILSCTVINEYSDYWWSTSVVRKTLVSDPTIDHQCLLVAQMGNCIFQQTWPAASWKSCQLDNGLLL